MSEREDEPGREGPESPSDGIAPEHVLDSPFADPAMEPVSEQDDHPGVSA